MANKLIYSIQKSVLDGKVSVSGAKNSYLRLLAASILTHESITLHNSPLNILDGIVHIEMLKTLGKSCEQTLVNSIKITENTELHNTLKWEDRSIRNTLLILGALTTRYGKGSVPLPGGCKLGDRKYDLHVYLLERLGAKVYEEDGNLIANAPNGLVGSDIDLPIRSTGATENSILCGTLAKGKTTVWNPHIRPEIIDLISMLNKMGAQIEVFGQERIEIVGKDSLQGCEHTVIPDNVEALTWLIASVLTKGDIQIDNFPFEDLEVPLIFLKESGAVVYRNGDSAIVRGGTPYPLEISTGPYPGINSDMQPMLAVYGSMAKGETRIIDLRFPGRYQYASELERMGMSYQIKENLLIINGGNEFHGTDVRAVDIRAGASLVIAALIAKGTTHIHDAHQIERGYNNFVNKLKSLGGQIKVKK